MEILKRPYAVLLFALAILPGCAPMNGASPSEPSDRGPCVMQQGSNNRGLDTALKILGALAGTGDSERRRCSDGMCVVAEQVSGGDAVQFYFENEQAGTVTASIKIDSNNLLPYIDASFPESSYVLAACERRFISTYRRLISWQGWHYNYTFSWDWGKEGAEPVGTFIIPVLESGSIKLLHNPSGKADASFRFQAPVGTTVVAARPGVVVNIAPGNPSGNVQIDDPSWETSSIFVENQDGTIDRYYYVDPTSARVALGQQVRAGDALALVGPSTGGLPPYLHFEVTAPEVSDHQVSSLISGVPFKIEGRASAYLVEGKSFRRARS